MCKFLFEDSMIDPKRVMENAVSAASEFEAVKNQVASSRNGIGVIIPPSEIQKSPKNGAIKVNFDDAWKNHDADLGVVMRNQNKEFCFGYARKRSCNRVLNAETEAAIEALMCAIQRAYSRIV